jgi:hypothetical protein
MSEPPDESELNRLRESFKLQLDRHSRGEMSETERVAFERELSRMWESFHLKVDRYCRGQPSEPVAPPPGLTSRTQITSQNNRPDGGSAAPVTAEMTQDVVQRAREISEAIKRAGQHAGAARRGERLCRVLS